MHRALKWAKFLPKYGWEPIIYTAENAQYPFFDAQYAEKIPTPLKVVKYPIREVQSIFKRLSGRKKDHALVSPLQVRNKGSKRFDAFAVWVRSNFFIPDARMLWIKPSAKFLVNYLKDNPVDAIISTGPPHTSNVIGCKVHEQTSIPWIVDFQDPWTQADYYRLLSLLPMSDKKHKRMEQEVLTNASRVTTVSQSWASDLESIGAKDVVPLYFGFDRDDFTNIKARKDEYFSIIHAGMLGFDRLPENLFKVLAELINENAEFKKLLKIRLAGMVDYTVLDCIEKYGLNNHLELLGNISLNQSYELALSSDIQLLLLNKAYNAKGRIPGKLFEYLVVNKPILCLGTLDSDVAGIIQKTSSGKSFEYTDYDKLKIYISDLFEVYLKGENTHRTTDISEYSVEHQTKILSELLNKIADIK